MFSDVPVADARKGPSLHLEEEIATSHLTEAIQYGPRRQVRCQRFISFSFISLGNRRLCQNEFEGFYLMSSGFEANASALHL